FLLDRLLVERRGLGGAEENGAGVEPIEMLDAALQARERPGLAAERVEEPQLRLDLLLTLFRFALFLGRVPLGLGRGPGGEEGNELAVGRPPGRGATVRAARQFHFLFRSEARTQHLVDRLPLVLV